MDQHARTPFATVYDIYLWSLTENKALSAAAARAFDSKGNRLTQHWIDFHGRVLQGAMKAQQRQLIGAAEYAEQPLTVQTARSLLTPTIDSAVSKSEGRLDAKYSTRIGLLETSVGSLETTVTSELRYFKAEMKEFCRVLLQDHNATSSSSSRRAKEAGSDATARAREGDTTTPALQHQEAVSLLGVWWHSHGEELPARREA